MHKTLQFNLTTILQKREEKSTLKVKRKKAQSWGITVEFIRWGDWINFHNFAIERNIFFQNTPHRKRGKFSYKKKSQFSFFFGRWWRRDPLVDDVKKNIS